MSRNHYADTSRASLGSHREESDEDSYYDDSSSNEERDEELSKSHRPSQNRVTFRSDNEEDDSHEEARPQGPSRSQQQRRSSKEPEQDDGLGQEQDEEEAPSKEKLVVSEDDAKRPVERAVPIVQRTILTSLSSVLEELRPLNLPSSHQREEQINQASQRFDRIGKPLSVAITGPAGSGKSLLVNGLVAPEKVRNRLKQVSRAGQDLPDSFPLRSTAGVGLHVTKEVTCLRRPLHDRGDRLRLLLTFSSRSEIMQRGSDLRLTPAEIDALDAFVTSHAQPAAESSSLREIVLVDTDDVFEFIEVVDRLDAQLEAKTDPTQETGPFPSGVPALPPHASIGLLERILEGPWNLPQTQGKPSAALFDTIGFTEGADVDANASAQDRSQGANWKNSAVLQRVDAVLLVSHRIPTMTYIGELGSMGALRPRPDGEATAALVLVPWVNKNEFGTRPANAAKKLTDQEQLYVRHLADFDNAARTLVHSCGLSKTVTLFPPTSGNTKSALPNIRSGGVAPMTFSAPENQTARERMRITNSLVLRTATLPRFVADEQPKVLWDLLQARCNEDAITAAVEMTCNANIELSRMLKSIMNQKDDFKEIARSIPRSKIDNVAVRQGVIDHVSQLLLGTSAAVDPWSIAVVLLQALRPVVEDALDSEIATHTKVSNRDRNSKKAKGYTDGSAEVVDEFDAEGSAYERDERFFEPIWATFVSTFTGESELEERCAALNEKISTRRVTLPLRELLLQWDNTVLGWNVLLENLRERLQALDGDPLSKSTVDEFDTSEPSSDRDDDAQDKADADEVAKKITHQAIGPLAQVLVVLLQVLLDVYVPLVPANTKSKAERLGISITDLSTTVENLKKQSIEWAGQQRSSSFTWTANRLWHSEHYLPAVDGIGIDSSKTGTTEYAPLAQVVKFLTTHEVTNRPMKKESKPFSPDLNLVETNMTGEWNVSTATSSQLPVICVDLKKTPKIHVPDAVIQACQRLASGTLASRGLLPIFVPSWCPSNKDLNEIPELNLQLASGYNNCKEFRGQMLDGMAHVVFVVVEARQWEKYYDYLRDPKYCPGLCGVVLVSVNVSVAETQAPVSDEELDEEPDEEPDEKQFWSESLHAQGLAHVFVDRQKFGVGPRPDLPILAPRSSSIKPRRTEEIREGEICLKAKCLLRACQLVALVVKAEYWSLADHCLVDSAQWSVQRILSESCTFARCFRGAQMVLYELDEQLKKHLAQTYVNRWKESFADVEFACAPNDRRLYEQRKEETNRSLELPENVLLQDYFDQVLSATQHVLDTRVFPENSPHRETVEEIYREIKTARQKCNTVYTVDFGSKRYQVHVMLGASGNKDGSNNPGRPFTQLKPSPTRGYYGLLFFRGRGAAPFWTQFKKDETTYVERRQSLYHFADSICEAFKAVRKSTKTKAALHAKCDLWAIDTAFAASSDNPGPLSIVRSALNSGATAYSKEYHDSHPCGRSWDQMCKSLDSKIRFDKRHKKRPTFVCDESTGAYSFARHHKKLAKPAAGSRKRPAQGDESSSQPLKRARQEEGNSDESE